ncbi:MAG: hypothetical protein H6738_21825 [Alphaproteobacteria bacterium]|nr:hypothetical protein [Alphaproteobacteria bacterium]MCB9699437.1 hypothetical protein [Alphaproteobacteria bacterium]
MVLAFLASSLRVGLAQVSTEVTDTELLWMVREVAPMVEEVTGRRFTELPEVVSANVEDVAQVVFDEQLHLLADSGMSDHEAREHASRTAVATAPALAGKYGFLDHKLYLSVDGIETALAIEGEEPWLLRPLLRVVIAHELTHALQDQATDLDKLVGQASGSDAVMAMNCLVEGHAVWVHEQVGAALELPEAVEVMKDLLGFDQPIRRRMDPQAFQSIYVYGLGRDFVAYQAEHGGSEQVWRVLADPPDTTSMIVAPWTWAEDPAPPLDGEQRRILRRASARLAGHGWRTEENAMGDYDVRDQLVRAGADLRIADSLDQGWNTRLVGGAMAGVEVQVLRFTSEEGAHAFVEGMFHEAEVQARMVGQDPFIRADAEDFAVGRHDRGAREAITVTLMAPEVVDHLGRVWVARGSDVVQVVLVNAPATDRQVRSAIARVFRALDAG